MEKVGQDMRGTFIAALLAVVLAAGCTRLPGPFESQTSPALDSTPLANAAAPQQPMRAGTPVSAHGLAPEQSPEAAARTVEPSETRPRITLTEPDSGAVLVNGATIRGSVLNVPADKTLIYRVYDDRGRVIGRGPIAVEGDYGGPGTFEGPIGFAPLTAGGSGQLEILVIKQSDGSVTDSTWINVGFGRRLAPLQGKTASIALVAQDPDSKFHSGDELQGTITITPPQKGLLYRVYDFNGNLVGSGPIRVRGEPGGTGSFSAPISFDISVADAGRIVVVDESPADGRLLARAAQSAELAPGATGAGGSATTPAGGQGPGRLADRAYLPNLLGPGSPTMATPLPSASPPAPQPAPGGLPLTTQAPTGGLPLVTPQPRGGLPLLPLQPPGGLPPVTARPAAGPPVALTAHLWELKAMGGQPVLPNTRITLQLTKDGQLGGFGGCNRYFGTYHLAGQAARIDSPGVGHRMCDLPAGVSDQETRFLYALAAVQRYRLEGGELRFFIDQDLPALVFTPG